MYDDLLFSCPSRAPPAQAAALTETTKARLLRDIDISTPDAKKRGFLLGAADLVEEIFASSLDKIAYFKSRSPEFRLAVFKAMRIAVFAPGERLCQPATLYLIINHGGLVGQDGRIHIRGSL